MRMGKGALTLLTTAENYGIEDKLTVVEKKDLDLILRRNEFSHLPFDYTYTEQKQILITANQIQKF